MASNRLMDKDMGWEKKLGVSQHQKEEDRIKDDLVGAGGSVTPLGLVTVLGSQNIT